MLTNRISIATLTNFVVVFHHYRCCDFANIVIAITHDFDNVIGMSSSNYLRPGTKMSSSIHYEDARARADRCTAAEGEYRSTARGREVMEATKINATNTESRPHACC